MDHARLVTIPISHYCEKARWVLDQSGMSYIEEPHAPVAHLRATRALGGKTVPILVHGGRVLRDSSAIASYAESLAPPELRLLPGDAAERARALTIEEEIDETVGVDARLLAYWYQLSDDEAARVLVGRMMRIRSRVALRIIPPMFRALIFRKYRVSRDAAERAERRIVDTFVKHAQAIERERYLVAGRFTLADLTLAALASPLMGPPEHPINGRSKLTPTAPLVALRKRLADTATGDHVLRVYREHRNAKSAATKNV